MTKKIALTQGKVALVSDEDYASLSNFKWHAYFSGTNWYAQRTYPRLNGMRRTISMHRAIVNAPSDMQVDHRDRDGLNNQRENLRLCTQNENSHNSDIRINNTSGYKGVSWHKNTGKWQAKICLLRKPKHLGIYPSAEEAAHAYDAAAMECFGQFARLNFPVVHEEQVSE